ncbi:MAG: maleylpyruvate isomerase family mycothiol-dependent enzyme [Acidimicrobiia bacterium]
MKPAEHLAAVRDQSEALARAAEVAGLHVPIQSCGDWVMLDLVTHVGNVQRWAALTVETRPTARINRDAMNEAPSADEAVAWFRRASAGLVSTLEAADVDAPVWTFVPYGTTAFWFRRQAQEVSVHRWDADLSAGNEVAIDPALAVDGIGEWLDLSVPLSGDRLTGDGETVHLHCTDASHGAAGDDAGEWLITFTSDGPTVVSAHEKADAAARGTASDLNLFLWGRREPSDLEVFGDVALLERLRGAGAH